jgi:hypothetical protein
MILVDEEATMPEESQEYKDRVRGVWIFVMSYVLAMFALFVIAILVSLGPGPATPF